MENRKHKFRDKHPQTMEEVINEITDIREDACPDCGNHLFKAIVKDGATVWICTYCGLQAWTEGNKT